MSTAGLINRYVWFVTTIYNRGPISLEEIQRRYESHFGRGEELSERQFYRYTDAVEELFDIEIKYSRTLRGYMIADREGIIIWVCVNGLSKLSRSIIFCTKARKSKTAYSSKMYLRVSNT